MDSAIESSVSIIARTPLCFGFLTGNFRANTKFKSSDHRSRWSKKQVERWINGLNIMKETYPPSQDPIQFALRFCLSFDSVVSAIPGMLTKKEVVENAQSSAAGPLTTYRAYKNKKSVQNSMRSGRGQLT